MQPNDWDESDGEFVRVEEYVRFSRFVPRRIYEITQALKQLDAPEQIRVMKYIARITGKRIVFSSLAKSKKKSGSYANYVLNRLQNRQKYCTNHLTN